MTPLLYKWLPITVWIVGGILIFIPISKTASAIIRNSELNTLAKKYGPYNGIKKRRPAAKVVPDSNIFEGLSISCRKNGVIVRQVDLPRFEDNGESVLKFQTITLAGEFIPILRAVNESVSSLQSAKLCSLNFEVHESNRQKELLATLTFEQIEKPHAHEN